jgi:hypothetical protein
MPIIAQTLIDLNLVNVAGQHDTRTSNTPYPPVDYVALNHSSFEPFEETTLDLPNILNTTLVIFNDTLA